MVLNMAYQIMTTCLLNYMSAPFDPVPTFIYNIILTPFLFFYYYFDKFDYLNILDNSPCHGCIFQYFSRNIKCYVIFFYRKQRNDFCL